MLGQQYPRSRLCNCPRICQNTSTIHRNDWIHCSRCDLPGISVHLRREQNIPQSVGPLLSSAQVFDKVAVLYEGRQIYFGNIHAAKAFFVNMGFECPLRQTTADFLTSLTSPAERVVRKGFEGKTPYTPDEFAAVWQKSEDRAQLLRDIDEFDREYPIGGEALEQFKVSRKGTSNLIVPFLRPY